MALRLDRVVRRHVGGSGSTTSQDRWPHICLLESAVFLGNPFLGADPYPDVHEKAAALAHSLIRNHRHGGDKHLLQLQRLAAASR